MRFESVPEGGWVWGVATARGERVEKCFLRLSEVEDEVSRSNLRRSRDRLVVGLEIKRWRLGAKDEEKRESLWAEERKKNLLEAMAEHVRERSRAVLSMDNTTLS